MNSEYRKMVEKLSKMSDKDLARIWNGLAYGDYDPEAMYASGVTMDEWAMEVQGQVDFRKSIAVG